MIIVINRCQINVNIDGGGNGSPSSVACIGIFRICRGFCKGCYARPLGILFAFATELVMVIRTVDYAQSFQCDFLQIECNSIYVVDLLRTRSRCVLQRILAIWNKIIHLLYRITYQASHIYREDNQVANKLYSKAVHVGDDA